MKTKLFKLFATLSAILIISFTASSQAYLDINYNYQGQYTINFEGHFQDSVTGFDTTYWHWDFGDGNFLDTVLINDQGEGNAICNILYEYIHISDNYDVCLDVTTNLGSSAADCEAVEIYPCSSLNVTYTVYDDSCDADNNDGSIELIASGGTPSYSFLWSTGDTTDAIYNLPSGEYCFTVTDAIECNLSYCVDISHYSTIWIDFTKQDVSTPDASDGEIELIAGGGISPYSYLWNTGFSNNIYTGLPAGFYSVTVADANNCTTEANISIISDYLSFTIDTCLYEGVDTSAYDVYQIDTTSTPGLLSITWLIPGEDSMIFIETEYYFEYPGVYSLELILNCAKYQSFLYATIQITEDHLTKNKNIIQNNYLTDVFPNPADDYLSIITNDIDKEKMIIYIFNIVGIIVLKEDIRSRNTSIDISHLSKGIYILKLIDKEGNIITVKKIIKE